MSELVTVAGRSVELRPVSSQVISEIGVSTRLKAIKRGDPIMPPMYKTTTAGGEIQEFPHDKDTIQTDEEKELWEAHQEAQRNLEVEISNATTRYMLSEGIVVDEIPKEWIERREWLGLDIPENRLDKKLLYIETELLLTPADVLHAMQDILHLAAQGSADMEERLVQLDELFRRALEGDKATD